MVIGKKTECVSKPINGKIICTKAAPKQAQKNVLTLSFIKFE